MYLFTSFAGSSQDAVSSTSVSEVPSACQPQQDLVPQTKPPEFLASSPVLPIVPNLSVPPPLPELFLSKLALPPPHPPPPPLPPPAPSEEPSEKYSLLLPPKHLSKELQTPKVKTKFEYAKVMSAQAMFPVGFDARLPSQSQTVTDNQQVPTLNKASSSLSRNQPNAEKITGKYEQKIWKKNLYFFHILFILFMRMSQKVMQFVLL